MVMILKGFLCPGGDYKWLSDVVFLPVPTPPLDCFASCPESFSLSLVGAIPPF